MCAKVCNQANAVILPSMPSITEVRISAQAMHLWSMPTQAHLVINVLEAAMYADTFAKKA